MSGSHDIFVPSWLKVKQKSSLNYSSPPTTSKYPTISTLADSGTTDFLIRSSDIPPHIIPTGPVITVRLPNNNHITSLGSVSIKVPHSSVTITAHIFNSDALSHNLSSISQLCVQGCTATFRADSVVVTDRDGVVILSGAKQIQDLLWTLPIPIPSHLPTPSISPQHSAPTSSNFAIHNSHDAEYVKFVHATFGSPAISTFHRAVRQGYLRSFPRISARMIRLNPPHSMATAKGHLDRVRQGTASTKPVSPGIPPPALPLFSDSPSPELDMLDCADPPTCLAMNDEDEHVFTKLVRSDESSHSDLTGKFPLTSRRGFSYILISVWRGYIHADLLKSRSAADYVKAYDSALTFFREKGNVRISLQRLDNETSGALDSFLRSRVDSVEYVPPHSHRANRAERAIRTFKNHLVACLSTTDSSFPLNIWDEILPQCELTLNHLQPFSLDPSISAYEGLHRAPFDFSSHPIAPCGTRVLVYESPSTRKTWAPHGVKGFYLGPSLSHHRVFRT